ncbi:hypothetical protein MXL15_09370 [Pseudomonas mosselii]|uniref:hypothetical protein n=1 Tax=Pseudomonas mosselii TaxID=78327 RepID=UPI002DB693D0|nr:hypothetical protein [Pseudomonas mosselii]MEB5932405.1 hypothetical protein [Pseudomonas mosselii]
MSITDFKMMAVAFVVFCSGCMTLDERLDECQSHGVSRDVCYQAERDDMRSILEHSGERFDRSVRDAENVKKRRKH